EIVPARTPMPTTYTYDTIQPATKPTFYFIGVTTGQSSIRRVFPAWAEELGLGDVEMVGIDLAVHAPPEHYRVVVQFLKDDPLSLGALVTTHKLDLYHAAGDLFDSTDSLAELMSAVSCLAKHDGKRQASAKEPYSSGLALDAFVPEDRFARSGAEVFIMGAGGSAIAIDWHLGQRSRGLNLPSRAVVSNRSTPRLETFQEVHEQDGNPLPLEIVHAPTETDNDAVLRALSPGALVINATGLGKDAPGSPLSDAAV